MLRKIPESSRLSESQYLSPLKNECSKKRFVIKFSPKKTNQNLFITCVHKSDLKRFCAQKNDPSTQIANSSTFHKQIVNMKI